MTGRESDAQRARREAYDRKKRENPGGFVGGDPSKVLTEEELRAKEAERLVVESNEKQKQRQRLGGARSIYNDPPYYWFGLYTYLAPTPLEHEAMRDVPLLTLLAYADNKAREEAQEAEMMKAQAKANPMGAMFGMGRRRGRR